MTWTDANIAKNVSYLIAANTQNIIVIDGNFMYNQNMKIRDFTVPELNKFRELCNFTNDEMIYFNLRAKDKSNIEIAMEMNVSESQVSKLAKRVKDKIKRII